MTNGSRTWNEADHPRDEIGRFTYGGGGGEDNSNNNDADYGKGSDGVFRLGAEVTDILSNESIKDVLYKNTTTSKVSEKAKTSYINQLLDILGNKATTTDKLYPNIKKLEAKIKESGLNNSKTTQTSSNTTKGSWQKPVQYTRISSPYGWRYHPVHKKYMGHRGIDLATPVGSKVTVPMGGTVEFAGTQNGYGYIIIVNHGNVNGKILKTKYAHLSKFNVKQGDKVKEGDNIGSSGGRKGDVGAGTSTGPHLHFEVLEDNKPVNPGDYFKY